MNHHLKGMGGPSLEVIEIGSAIRAIGPKPRALDLGAGEGRNSLFLSHIGFDVTSVEASPVVSSLLRQAARNYGTNVRVLTENVLDFATETRFDLCLLLGILHFLNPRDAKSVVETCKRISNVGAIHIVTVSPIWKDQNYNNSLSAQGQVSSISKDDLLFWYQDWKVLCTETYVKSDSHGEGIVEVHPIEKLVFCHPDSQNTNLVVHRHSLGTREIEKPSAFFSDFANRVVTIEEVVDQCGKEDFRVSTQNEPALLSGLRSPEITVCFWSDEKLYFELGRLVGIAKYLSPHFHSFNF